MIDRLETTLSRPLGGPTRGALLLGALLLTLALFLPLWRIHLEAQQFPEGLDLWIYPSRIVGGNGGQDLNEINVLNHYIGMKAIEPASFPEMKWLPFGIGVFALVSLRAVVLGRVRTLVDTIVLFVYFGGFALGSFYWRLYTYGHNLDPKAPMTVPPFTPPIIGEQQLANFHVTSLPQAGALLLAAYGLVLAGCLVVEWRRSRRAAGERVAVRIVARAGVGHAR
ncbi:MAG TPA: hypothetical protein VF406_20265 [Thermodesulfobacteriota bacterium]